MKQMLLAGLAVPLLLSSAVWAAETVDREARYQAELATAMAGTATVDWQTLRFHYVDRPGYDEGATDDLRKEMFKAFGAKDWAAAQTAARKVLEIDYTDALAHMTVGIAARNLGQAEEAEREIAMGRAIFRSIETGDGLSPETAFTVVAVSEEYDLMIWYGRDVGKQSLRSTGGHTYDVLETTGEDGGTIIYYFNVDRVFSARMESLKK